MEERIDPYSEPLHRYALGVFIDSFARSVNELPPEHKESVLEYFRRHCVWHLSHPSASEAHRSYVYALRQSLRANLEFLAKRRDSQVGG